MEEQNLVTKKDGINVFRMGLRLDFSDGGFPVQSISSLPGGRT